MHRPDLIEQFGNERQSQLLKEAKQHTRIHHAQQVGRGDSVRQANQAPSFVTRLYAIFRRQAAPSV